jgi:hypothetical protein
MNDTLTQIRGALFSADDAFVSFVRAKLADWAICDSPSVPRCENIHLEFGSASRDDICRRDLAMFHRRSRFGQGRRQENHSEP